MRWTRAKYAGRTGLSMKELRRRFCDTGWRFAHNGVVFTGASSVAVTRYRYRGSNIPTPWTPKPAAAAPAADQRARHVERPVRERFARRVRRAGRGNPPGAIPAGRPGPTQPPPRSGTLVHQLCTAHLLRDLDDAAQVYPDAMWPVQIADALRALIHDANQAREQGLRRDPRRRPRRAAAPAAQRRCWSGCPTPSPPRHPPRGTQGPAAAGGPARPPRRRAALRPRPEGAAHLEPGRTRPTARPRSSRRSPGG